jgi:hypothetical protein
MVPPGRLIRFVGLFATVSDRSFVPESDIARMG